jgi:hypothetical protein
VQDCSCYAGVWPLHSSLSPLGHVRPASWRPAGSRDYLVSNPIILGYHLIQTSGWLNTCR